MPYVTDFNDLVIKLDRQLLIKRKINFGITNKTKNKKQKQNKTQKKKQSIDV